MINFRLLCGAIASMLSFTTPASADAVIDLSVTSQHMPPPGETARLLVHQGKVLLAGVHTAADKDLRFDAAQNVFHIIDHRKRRVMRLDEAAAVQLVDQTEAMMTMARGFSEQLSMLPPKQRAKLEKLIGGDKQIAGFAKRGDQPPGKLTFRAAGGKSVNGIACERLDVLGNGQKQAELCLAKAGSLPLEVHDYATLEAMLRLAQRLAEKAAPLIQRFGLPVPPLNDAKASGLPVEIKRLSGKKKDAISLTGISPQPVEPRSLEIPAGYAQRPLTAWKF